MTARLRHTVDFCTIFTKWNMQRLDTRFDRASPEKDSPLPIEYIHLIPGGCSGYLCTECILQ